MNVILFIFDTLRKDSVGILGTPPWGEVKTPHLNSFAQDSTILTNCYPESLPTLPTRRAIYTGQRVYPFFDEKDYKGDFKGSPGWGPIKEDRSTISEILQQNGYTTGLVSDIMHQFKPSKNYHRGFSEWNWVRGYEVDTYRSGPYPSKEEMTKYLPLEVQNPTYLNFLSQSLSNIQDVRHEEDYFVAKVVKEGVNWLERNKDKKIFLTIESWSPHEPWFVPSYYREMYANGTPQNVLSLYGDSSHLPEDIITGTRANYSGLVTMCDRWFGYFIEAVKNMGIFDDTLIIVTADHGHSIGDNDFMGKRGYPSSPETIDSFILMRHPDSKYGRGKVTDILVQHTDITATILDTIGVNPEISDTEYEWNSMYEILLGKSDKKTRTHKIDMHGKSFLNAIRNEDKKFRDHVTVAWGAAVTVIKDNWWFNSRVNGKGAFLYDISGNGFKDNLADSRSELVKEMFSLALADAGGSFPEYLIKMADNQQDAPGCSALAAL